MEALPVNKETSIAVQNSTVPSLAACSLCQLPVHVLLQTFCQIPDAPWKLRMRRVNHSWNKLLRTSLVFAATHELNINLTQATSMNGPRPTPSVYDRAGLVFPGPRLWLYSFVDKLVPNLKLVTSLIIRLEGYLMDSNVLEHLLLFTMDNVRLEHLEIDCALVDNFHEKDMSLVGQFLTEHSSTLQSIKGFALERAVAFVLPELAQCTQLRKLTLQIKKSIAESETKMIKRLQDAVKFFKSMKDRPGNLDFELDLELHAHELPRIENADQKRQFSKLIGTTKLAQLIGQVLQALPNSQKSIVKLNLIGSSITEVIRHSNYLLNDLSWTRAIVSLIFNLQCTGRIDIDVVTVVQQVVNACPRLCNFECSPFNYGSLFPDPQSPPIDPNMQLSDFVFDWICTEMSPKVQAKLKCYQFQYQNDDYVERVSVQRLDRDVAHMVGVINERHEQKGRQLSMVVDVDEEHRDVLHSVIVNVK